MRAYLPPAVLGFATGLRSILPLAVLAHTRPTGVGDAAAWRLLTRPPLPMLLGLAAVGEIVADKLPIVPSRLAPPALAGRLVLGALTGGLAGRACGASVPIAALLGMSGAGLGAWLGSTLRVRLVELTGAPDFVFAVAEDGLTVTLSLRAAQPLDAG